MRKAALNLRRPARLFKAQAARKEKRREMKEGAGCWVLVQTKTQNPTPNTLS
jgi:hypothetical protein